MTLIAIIAVLIQGALLGSLYALFAMGLSLMFGVMRLTNIAHGDFLILSAFGALSLLPALGIHGAMAPWMALLALLPIAFAIGYALQRFILNGTLGKDPLPSLVVTFGISIVIQNMLMEIFTADPRAIETAGLNTQSLQIHEGLTIGLLPLIIFIVAIAIAFAMQWLFSGTALGRAFRATSDDGDTAKLMGVESHHIYALATAIAFVLIAVAGTLQGMRTTVAPADGPALLIYAFEAVIIGGMGSFWGTFVGGIVLGITQVIGFRIDPGWGIWCGHVVFLAMLLVKPQGLFPKTR
ncbi:MAG TPA: branched-chain amino acid ABC transporter permease [Eoetvoesiella sp.]|uniref:branched-chain amino acid ABC transporter permease n=1 Tax=Eoetvoesiella sp. TaxID=1966355 RepID=UPI002C25DBB4|nr:branched-chain amino acid ABC transporter permease [Eoetvoesiella sp.]HWK62886.1 branched-chain amino acid ABC transporter permease [Eoetvoesiella sp.]